MKKKLLTAVLLIGLLFSGCSKSGEPEAPGNGNPPPNEQPNPNQMTVNYEDDIKGIIQSNCLSCHQSPPINLAPMALTTYEEVMNAVENRGLLSRINSTTNPMPAAGRMPAATRQLIEDWVDQGFPEN